MSEITLKCPCGGFWIGPAIMGTAQSEWLKAHQVCLEKQAKREREK